MSLFAKDLDYLEVSAAEFLPDGRRLFIVVADSDCNIHVLQYDPEGRTGQPKGYTQGLS